MSADNPPVGDALDLPPPALRDVLRVCLSAKEYRFLHESVIKRAPAVQNKLPSPSRYDVIARPKNRLREAAIRSSLRVFVGSRIVLKLADLLIKSASSLFTIVGFLSLVLSFYKLTLYLINLTLHNALRRPSVDLS
ncbi:hypothetical protein ACN42_g6477 [Penicillium freii]|uniref:Uncharacterized protein n=1 Tax=Penicillium freii TaxID=48697 RepID=A0A101MHG4_PENFR|nr:hypothetical protein ACN42_g6477 [Penicillium freii]